MAASADKLVTLPKEFDVSKVSLSEPKGPDGKAKTVYVNYSKGNRLIVQTPEMRMPFGLSKWDNDGKSTPKFSLGLSFDDMDSRSSVKAFYDMLVKMDDLAVETAIKHKKTWFKGKPYTDDTLRAIFTPSIKFPKDKEGNVKNDYPPTFKVSLGYNEKENVLTTEVYDAHKNQINLLDCETKGARAAVIMQCAGIWMTQMGFGLSWRAIQVRVQPPTTIRGFAFKATEDDGLMDESDIEDEQQPSAKKDDAHEHEAAAPDEQGMQGDDDDDDDDDVPPPK